MLIQLDPDSKVPAYLQIVQDLRNKIMTAKVHAHEKLPSVRGLARELGLNPNTVHKAYTLLKNESLIYTLQGVGEFVAENTNKLKELKRDRIIQTLVATTKEARDSGMWIDEIFTIIDEAYSER